MSTTAIVRTCSTLNEAYICRGLLQTHGIHASIDNAEHAAVDWFIVQALGGVYVRVPISQLHDAQEAMVEHINHADQLLSKHALRATDITTSQRGKAILMVLIWFGVLHVIAGLAIWLADQAIPRSWINHADACLALQFGTATELERMAEIKSWDDLMELADHCQSRTLHPHHEHDKAYEIAYGGWVSALTVGFVFSLTRLFKPKDAPKKDPQL